MDMYEGPLGHKGFELIKEIRKLGCGGGQTVVGDAALIYVPMTLPIVKVIEVGRLIERIVQVNPSLSVKIQERPDCIVYELDWPRQEALISEPTRLWREQDCVIYFSVTSDGTTGEGWITRLESKGFQVGGYAKQVLRSQDFKPTTSVTTEVAILKGMLFQEKDRITKKIRAEAKKRQLLTPNPEVSYLIREKFTDQDIEAMGLAWIMVMHEPVGDSVGELRVLGVGRIVGGGWLDGYSSGPGYSWGRDDGFAFVVPSK